MPKWCQKDTTEVSKWPSQTILQTLKISGKTANDDQNTRLPATRLNATTTNWEESPELEGTASYCRRRQGVRTLPYLGGRTLLLTEDPKTLSSPG